MPSLTLHEKLETDGYVIIEDLVSPEMTEKLKAACERAIAKARAGEWTERRTVGKQFPPWPKDSGHYDIWAVQHVMNPALGEPAFTEWYGSEKLIATICEILEVKKEELQLELFNLLINPVEKVYGLEWHRDCIAVKVDEEEELTKLAIPHYGTQWNTALYDDSCFVFVPRSHNRLRTAEEKKINIEEPYGIMPGQIILHLKAGQTVFYNNNLLHRADYPQGLTRASLHASMGDTRGGSVRAENIFQHGLDWMKSEEFRKTIPENALTLHDNLLRLADANKGKAMVYQHPDDGFHELEQSKAAPVVVAKEKPMAAFMKKLKECF